MRASATALALTSSVLFSAMAMVVRMLSHTIPGGQIAWVRFAVGLAVVMVAALRISLRPRRWGWVIARGVFGGTAVLVYFTSIEKIGVGVTTLLNYTAPIWSLIFAWALLRERPRGRAFIAFLFTLMGIALLASEHDHGWDVSEWELLATLSAVLSGMAITSIRASRRQNAQGPPSESSFTVFASFTTIGLLATLPSIVPPWGRWVAPSAIEWVWLVVCGLLSVAAQILMTSSLDRLTAVGLGVLQQTTVVLSMAGGMIFFGETLTLRGMMGSLITMAGVLCSLSTEGQSIVLAKHKGSGAGL